MSAVRKAVLVNGVPASGKSTVARAISTHFGWPLLTLDAIKEPFFECAGVVDRGVNRQLGRASYAAIFNLIAGFPAEVTTVVDAWFGFQPLETLTGHLQQAGITSAVEIWCHADVDTIANRYRTRVATRPIGHPGLDYLPELIDLVGRAKPFGIFECLAVDTGKPLDPAIVAAWIEDKLELAGL